MLLFHVLYDLVIVTTLFSVVATFIPSEIHTWSTRHNHQRQFSCVTPTYNKPQSFVPSSSLRAAARYGPPSEPPNPTTPLTTTTNNLNDENEKELPLTGQEEWEKSEVERVSKQKEEFRNLIKQMINTTDPGHLPSLMTRNIDLLLSMRGYEGVSLMKDIIQEAQQQQQNGGVRDERHVERVTGAIDYVISFVDEFVRQAKSLDDTNKQLLGKIIRAMTAGNTELNESGDKGGGGAGGREEELLLDELLEREKENFTPGFLRHVEGECSRIEAAPRMSRESAKMLQTLRLIQVRVVEELGKDLGEPALVLGQLLGYDEKSERLAVLDAGLTVRGVEFAKEMVALTEEALDGFQRVPGGVDPGLVARVTEIDKRIRRFIKKSMG